MACLYSLVYCLWARLGAYLIVEHLEGSSIGLVPALQTDIRLGWKGLHGQTVSLLRTFINYSHKKLGHKKFYNIGPWPNIVKLLRT
jgi:hypothetical protein